MILSNINNNNTKKRYTQNLLKVIKSLSKLKYTKNKIKKINNNLISNNFNSHFNKIAGVNHNVVKYVIKVILSTTNIIINITDIKGNVILSISAGTLKLTKFQKRKQPTALLSVLKLLFLKATFLRNKAVAIHFRNVKRFHESLFINSLKTKLFIKSFQSYNLSAHNGCRPKKIKRVKRRTKRLILK
jgi:ribosomal protein S11